MRKTNTDEGKVTYLLLNMLLSCLRGWLPYLAMVKQLFTLVLLLEVGQTLAASFNCGIATNWVEQTICSNPELSTLDDRLNERFKNRLGVVVDNKSLVLDQRKWVAVIRDKCADYSCLTKSYNERIEFLGIAVSEGRAACPISEKQLLGSWRREKIGEFEEVAFARESGQRTFTSWLHHHPELTGHWVFENCEIHIFQGDNPKLSFDYSVERFSRNTIFLRDISGPDQSVYKRVGRVKH
jgi:uncharacterized protein